MQIQQPQPNTNFTARYRVLLTEKEFDDFHENILPKLDKIHDGNVDYLHAKSPSEFAFSEALEDYAKGLEMARKRPEGFVKAIFVNE